MGHLVELLPMPGELATWLISFWRPDLNLATWSSCCRCLVSWPPGRTAAGSKGGILSR
nr:hypothetical protein [Klebsiella pneumoniae]